MREEDVGRGAAPARIGRRKMLADVAVAERAEHRVVSGMQHTSASEWPARPRSCGMRTPPSMT